MGDYDTNRRALQSVNDRDSYSYSIPSHLTLSDLDGPPWTPDPRVSQETYVVPKSESLDSTPGDKIYLTGSHILNPSQQLIGASNCYEFREFTQTLNQVAPELSPPPRHQLKQSNTTGSGYNQALRAQGPPPVAPRTIISPNGDGNQGLACAIRILPRQSGPQ